MCMQVKSEDLKVFVEVLQRLNPEPADMLQLRASEAQLRSKVAKLQADAAGHPLQQTINQLQQAEVSKSLGAILCSCCLSMDCNSDGKLVKYVQHMHILDSMCCTHVTP